jgi:hypothetical protein
MSSSTLGGLFEISHLRLSAVDREILNGRARLAWMEGPTGAHPKRLEQFPENPASPGQVLFRNRRRFTS